MGWPKKNEGLRLYFERKDKTYLLLDPELRTPDGSYEAVGELMQDPDPTRPQLVSTSVSHMHLYKHCRRAAWGDMPEVWQKAMEVWLTKKPGEYRGLWRLRKGK